MPNATTQCEAAPPATGAWLAPAGGPAAACRNQPMADSVLEDQRMLRVLVADDCAANCETLAMLLKVWGHEARTACDGAAALEIAAGWIPDVVLGNIAMPILNGYDLARQLRQQACFQQTLLIAISGYADEAHRLLGLEAGYDLYLAKPAEPTRLRQLLFVELNRLRMKTRGWGPQSIPQLT